MKQLYLWHFWTSMCLIWHCNSLLKAFFFSVYIPVYLLYHYKVCCTFIAFYKGLFGIAVLRKTHDEM